MNTSENRAQKSNHKRAFPRLTYLANVHPRLHFCRDAALFRLSGGLDRLVYADRPESKEVYGLYLNGISLAEARIPSCGTCGTFLWAGYGDGLINETECMTVRDQINAGYRSLKHCGDVLAPIIGLMKSGLYLVADFDLFPVQDGVDYFWDVPDYNGELHFEHWYVGGWRVSHHQPFFLAPSQRAALMNPARVDAYRRRIQDGEDDAFPRAIALYMNGGVALLLDGHHKAAACAAEGTPVKTLVIFQVSPEKQLECSVNDRKRLYLQDEIGPFSSCSPLSICDGEGVKLGVLNCMESKDKRPVIVHEPEKVAWGRVPDECRTTHFCDYPNTGLLSNISELPPSRIRTLIETEMKLGKDAHDMRAIGLLRTYAALFPEGKWLSASERAWLAREDQEFNPTEIWGAPV